MTEITRTSADARIHAITRDTYRSSCNSTPEVYAPTANGNSNGNYRNPPLQVLNGHSNSCSTGSSSLTNREAFEEREMYYVSPTKRKSSRGENRSENLHHVRRSSMTWNPLSLVTATIQKKRPDEARSPTTDSGGGIGILCHPSYGTIRSETAAAASSAAAMDNFENSSHYSDSAMQLLRSGSCSGVGGVIGNNNLVTAASSSSSSMHTLLPSATAARTSNNVTFSNCTEERPFYSSRGSLRRSKGRSNQSLCSCDAGAETEINPDPIRPLYQYSLERRSKGHTYTCEQNAQILMRLERERNRKLSLKDSAGKDAFAAANNASGKSCVNSSLDSQTDSQSDVDLIPAPPPPPALANRKPPTSLFHHTDLLPDCGGSGSISGMGNSFEVSSILDDCASTMMKCANVGSNLAFSIGQSVKPDVCHVNTNASTTADDRERNTRMGRPSTPSGGGGGNICPCIRDDFSLVGNSSIMLNKMKKSDEEETLCAFHAYNQFQQQKHQHLQQQQHHHLEPFEVDENFHNRSSLSLGKYNTIGPSSEYAKQLASYATLAHHQKHPQHNSSTTDSLKRNQQRNLERLRCLSQSLSNFSTSGGGGGGGTTDSLRHLHHTSHHHLHSHPYHQQQHQHQHQQQQQHSRHIGDVYQHEGYKMHWHSNCVNKDRSNGGTGGGSGSGGIGGAFVDLTTMPTTLGRHPYTQLQTPSNAFSSCSFGGSNILNSSFTTLASGSSSGLKEKLQHEQMEQHMQHKQLQKQLHSSSSTTSIMPWKHRQCPSRGSSSSGTNSFRFDAAKHWLAVSSILLIIGAASVAVPLALRVAASAPFEERLRVAIQLLDQVPLIDGHNDLPWNIRKFLHNKLNDFNFDEDLRNVMPWARSQWSHTDLQRLKKGRISAQFWAAYVPCEAQHRDAVQLTLEQIDVIKRLTERYSPQLTTCTSAADIIEAHKNHQLCSLTGVEGGHSLGGSLAVLRTLYAIGVRYMTLTSTCHTPWADSSHADAPTFNVKHGGLTIFGKFPTSSYKPVYSANESLHPGPHYRNLC
ncbi:uncharacterized protein LOC129950714 [Eupeodes corollae]|uniref:uncharacterized protein LOC129950714 n=1 Tax=Eupeodes corollae TaxID=290404 RepID=UPI00249025DA|nr:uncharacterized protein LOC129950714 [Eupeodes corollae]